MLRIEDMLNSFDENDIEQVLSDYLPGIRHSSKDGHKEILNVYESVPILKHLVAKSLHNSRMGRKDIAKQYTIIINMLIMIYKKDKNSFIDKLLSK